MKELIRKSSLKEQLEHKKHQALIREPNFDSEVFNEFIKVKDEKDAVPIEGWDLIRWCAAIGAKVINFDDVQIQETYFLEFRGLGSYWAIKST